MNDLVKQIIDKTGIPADKAQQVVGVVGNFIKQKFPMIAGQVDSVLGGSNEGGGSNDNASGGSNPLGDIGGKLGF